MKICFCGDVHFCTHSSIVRKQGRVLSQRLEYLINTITWVENQAQVNNCDFIVYLGDFFDRNNLTAEELTALNYIKWSNVPKIFLVGNHEMQSKDLFVNSTNLFNYLPSSTVVQKPITYPLTNTYDITFIPYQLHNEISNSISDNISNTNCLHHLICSHIDLKGVNMGTFISEAGYDLDDILNSCDMLINGHLHNGTEVVKNRIINIGNICGQNFSEDASKYEHHIMIMDVEDSIKYSYIENPFALNFYKLDIKNNFLPNLKSNAVVTIKTDDPVGLKQKLSEVPNILEYRILHNIIKSDTTKQELNQVSIDHVSEFKQYMLNTYENNKYLLEELSQI